MALIKLSELTYGYLGICDSWAVLYDTVEDEDVSLKPAEKNADGLIAKSNLIVWCLCNARFSNGDKHLACAMCYGNTDEGPLLWTIWNGTEDVGLMLPPAPPFVLEVEGPAVFCQKFGKKMEDVFPILFEVVPLFETTPNKRMKTLYPV